MIQRTAAKSNKKGVTVLTSRDQANEVAKAVRRVNARLALYIHLAIYVAVNLLLLLINLLTSPGYLWFLWPLLGWGLGIAIHALATTLIPEVLSLRQRMIEKELR
jgi:hypothetical protein